MVAKLQKHSPCAYEVLPNLLNPATEHAYVVTWESVNIIEAVVGGRYYDKQTDGWGWLNCPLQCVVALAIMLFWVVIRSCSWKS